MSPRDYGRSAERQTVIMTDQQLLQQYLEGDTAAIKQLIQRHAAMIYQAARRQVDPQDAEKIAHASFLLLADRASRLLDRISVAGWLHEVTCHACQRHLKHQAKERRNAQSLPRPAAAAVPECKNDFRSQIDGALLRLGERDREIMLRAFFEKHSPADAASALAISPATFEKRSSRACEKLNRLLEKKGLALGRDAMMQAILSETGLPVPESAVASALSAPEMARQFRPSLRRLLMSWGHQSSFPLLWRAAAVLVLIIAAGIITSFVVNRIGNTSKVVIPPPPFQPAAPATVLPSNILVEPAMQPADAASPLHVAGYAFITEEFTANKLRAIGSAEQSESSKFTLYRMPAVDLHRFVRTIQFGPAREALGYAARNVQITQNNSHMYNILPYLQGGRDNDDDLLPINWMQGYWRTQGQASQLTTNADRQLALNINATLDNGRAYLGEPYRTNAEFRGDIKLKTQLAQQDVLLMISDTVRVDDLSLVLIMVLEPFGATMPEARVMQSLSEISRWNWATYGPDAARWVADRALAWESKAQKTFMTNKPGLPEWEKTAGDVTVRVLAISRSDMGALCWWDPQGDPLRGVPPERYMSNGSGTFCVLVEASAPKIPPATQDAKNRNRNNDNFSRGNRGNSSYNNTDNWSQISYEVNLNSPRIRVGVDGGEGQLIGEVERTREKQRIGDVDLRLSTSFGATNNVSLWTQCPYRENVEYYFVLKLKNGRVMPMLGAPRPVISAEGPDRGGNDNLQCWSSVQWKEVDKLELWSRPRVWVSFDNLKVTPNTPVPATIPARAPVSLATGKAAPAAAMRNTPAAQPANVAPPQPSTIPAKKNIPASSPSVAPDPKTPVGSLAMIYEDARKKDVDAVKAALYVTAGDVAEQKAADVIARLIVAIELLNRESEKRFGKDESQSAFTSTIARDVISLSAMQWQIDGDIATIANGSGMQMVLRKGRWLLDFRTKDHGGVLPDEFLAMTEKLKDLPVAIDELRAGIRVGKYATAQDAAAVLTQLTRSMRDN